MCEYDAREFIPSNNNNSYGFSFLSFFLSPHAWHDTHHHYWAKYVCFFSIYLPRWWSWCIVSFHFISSWFFCLTSTIWKQCRDISHSICKRFFFLLDIFIYDCSTFRMHYLMPLLWQSFALRQTEFSLSICNLYVFISNHIKYLRLNENPREFRIFAHVHVIQRKT